MLRYFAKNETLHINFYERLENMIVVVTVFENNTINKTGEFMNMRQIS